MLCQMSHVKSQISLNLKCNLNQSPAARCVSETVTGSEGSMMYEVLFVLIKQQTHVSALKVS